MLENPYKDFIFNKKYQKLHQFCITKLWVKSRFESSSMSVVFVGGCISEWLSICQREICMSSLHMTSRICSDKYLSSTRCAEPRTPPAIQNRQVLSARCSNPFFLSFFFFFLLNRHKQRKERQIQSSALEMPLNTTANVLSHPEIVMCTREMLHWTLRSEQPAQSWLLCCIYMGEGDTWNWNCASKKKIK